MSRRGSATAARNPPPSSTGWASANINPASAAGASSAAEYLENERRRIERENDLLKHGMRSVFDVGLPPKLYPSAAGYTEYYQHVKEELGEEYNLDYPNMKYTGLLGITLLLELLRL
jgi:hypothetical protein